MTLNYQPLKKCYEESPRSDRSCSDGSATPYEQAEQEQHKKHYKEDLRDSCCRRGYTTKTEYGRKNCYD